MIDYNLLPKYTSARNSWWFGARANTHEHTHTRGVIKRAAGFARDIFLFVHTKIHTYFAHPHTHTREVFPGPCVKPCYWRGWGGRFSLLMKRGARWERQQDNKRAEIWVKNYILWYLNGAERFFFISVKNVFSLVRGPSWMHLATGWCLRDARCCEESNGIWEHNLGWSNMFVCVSFECDRVTFSGFKQM